MSAPLTDPTPAPAAARPRRRLRWIVLAIVVVGGVLAGALVVSAQDDEAGPNTDDASTSTTAESAPAPAPPRSDGTTAQRRFIRVGATGGRQFTDDELRYLADNYEYVLFTKYHGGYDIELHHEAARRLKELNPDVKVFPYFSTKYWYEQNQWGTTPEDDWLLRDNNGELVRKRRGGEEQDAGVYVDLANPEYREWAIGVLRSWLEAAPYDGISFDSADLIGDYPEREADRWQRDLGTERIEEYNDGLKNLLREAGELVGDDGEVLYNGIAPGPLRGPDRGLELLPLTDGALNERFCLDARGRYNDVEADLTLLETERDGQLFMRATDTRDTQGDERDQLVRYCFGAFLLGWEPGLSYFQFGNNYTVDQVRDDPALLNVDLGDPEGPSSLEGSVGRREFERGLVIVNLSDRATTAALPDGYVVADGGSAAGVANGNGLKLGPRDAVILLAEGQEAGD